MSKKVLNIDAITNELQGASLYFTRPSTPPPPVIESPASPEPVQTPEAKPAPEAKIRRKRPTVVLSETAGTKNNNDGTNERTFERTFQRINIPTKKRTKIRHTFDIFEDQLLSLREIALDQEKMFGERVLLGDLAQQALDMLIAKEKNS